jgi:hypothetical protein
MTMYRLFRMSPFAAKRTITKPTTTRWPGWCVRAFE